MSYRACAHCRKPFESKYATQLYCSLSCRARSKDLRTLARHRGTPPRERRPFATYSEEAKDSYRERARSWRVLALEALGSVCVLCGYDVNLAALQIDHIDGVGRDDPRGVGQTLYRRIVAGDTSGLQLLCANCHAIKTVENGDNLRRLQRRPSFRIPGFLVSQP